MILYFANRTMDILGQASTDLPEGFMIIDDLKTEEVDTGVSTFDCKIGFDKYTREQLEAMTDSGNYILRKNGFETEFYTIIDTEIDTKNQEIYVYAEDAGLDLLNEIAEAYEATEAHTAAWYVEKWIKDSGFEIGINEIPASSTRKLSWDGESTVTERLASIATQFDGFEVSYSYDIKGTVITNKYVNIHAKRGKDNGAKLRLNYDIDRIVIKKSVANIATGLRVTGGTPEDSETPITLKGYSYDDGDFWVGSDGILRSRKANAKWSRYVWNKEPNKLDGYGGHIIRTYSYDTTSQATLLSHAIKELKSLCEMEVNYEVDINKLPEDIKIGDRIDIIDDAGGLYLSSRILLLETSVTENTQKATIGEHLIKEDGISMKVQELAERFAESAKEAEKALIIAESAKTTATEAQLKVLQAASDLSKAEQNLAAVTSRVDATEAEITEAQKAVEEAQKAVADAESLAAAAQSTANSAASAASAAQSTANTANTAASNAQSTANTANSTANTAKANAATAQTTANTARTEAANAAKTATNYLNFSTLGLVIGDVTASTLGNNVLIDSTSVNIRKGSTVLASFGADLIELGKNNKTAEISLCGGTGKIKSDITNNRLFISADDEIALYSQGINLTAHKKIELSGTTSYIEPLTIQGYTSTSYGEGAIGTLYMNAKNYTEGAYGVAYAAGESTLILSGDFVHLQSYGNYQTILEANGYTGVVSAFGDVFSVECTKTILGNNCPIYAKTTGGVELSLAFVNATNQTFFGWGAYYNEIGTTYFDGNDVFIRSKKYITLQTANGIKIPNGSSGGTIYANNVSGTAVEILRLNNGTPPLLIVGDGLYNAGTGGTNICGGTAVRLLTTADRIILENSTNSAYSAHFRPYTNAKCTLGTASYKWYAVYANNATIQTSDRREKENIMPLGSDLITVLSEDGESEVVDVHSALFDRLQPVQYNFINGNKKTCYGLIAQDVIEVMRDLEIGEDSLDLVHHEFWEDSETGDTTESFGIAYTNLIALLIHEVQKLKTEVATLKTA